MGSKENDLKDSQKPRSENFSQLEKDIFVQDLLPKYKNVIENRGTSVVTRDEKARAWRQLCDEFNTISTRCHRTVDNLKNLWENMKRGARRSNKQMKRDVGGTGGGGRNTSDPSNNENRVLQVLGPSGTGLDNVVDGDSDPQAAQNSMVVMYNFPPGDPNGGHTETAEETATEDSETFTWSDSVPRKLYCKKPETLCPISKNGTSTTVQNSSSIETVTKVINQEVELAKRAKRRRPSIPQSETQKQLDASKLRLHEATTRRMVEENKRSQELFEIERSKKEKEAELLELQVLKMRRELELDKESKNLTKVSNVASCTYLTRILSMVEIRKL
ncbi:hypothetical protein QAD02_021022 [Eretmocerus hayati]|uniref:Uncharacterized protein n=1 Tax=Eretmocerus hayati TaxID=131215 RepID=A0ACC2PPJ7_9HYME|nr:hypothetical protein QAD02_021022 [Eretmocerus hayati]